MAYYSGTTQVNLYSVSSSRYPSNTGGDEVSKSFKSRTFYVRNALSKNNGQISVVQSSGTVNYTSNISAGTNHGILLTGSGVKTGFYDGTTLIYRSLTNGAVKFCFNVGGNTARTSHTAANGTTYYCGVQLYLNASADAVPIISIGTKTTFSTNNQTSLAYTPNAGAVVTLVDYWSNSITITDAIANAGSNTSGSYWQSATWHYSSNTTAKLIHGPDSNTNTTVTMMYRANSGQAKTWSFTGTTWTGSQRINGAVASYITVNNVTLSETNIRAYCSKTASYRVNLNATVKTKV